MKKLTKTITLLALLSGVVQAENHALIIGCCEKYPYINATPLYGTQNDARHIFEILVQERKVVKQHNTDYLLGANATFSNIKNSLKRVEDDKSLKRGDTLYMFYSGHGTSLSDKEFFNNNIPDHEKVVEWIKNSAGFIPYDYNPKDVLNTLLISKRDFVPTFTKLDKRGVNIVWITDSCYAGNGYRSIGDENPAKGFNLDSDLRAKINKITQQRYKKAPKYKHLLFYGASIATLPTQEKHYNYESRGEFSIEVEKCLNEDYGSDVITHHAFKECLKGGYSSYNYQPSFSPNGGEQANQVIMPSSKKQIVVKSKSYKELLFSLKSSRPLLKISIKQKWSSSNKPIKTFCLNEQLKATIGEHNDNYIIAFTKDENNQVIMIQPDVKNKQLGNTLFEMNVTDTFGNKISTVDKLKVFTTSNQETYRKIYTYANRKDGILFSGDIEEIYKILAKNRDFRTINVDVKSIKKDVKECNEGERE